MDLTHDYHIHIGPYFDKYYDFHDVFRALIDSGVKSIDCAYLTPRFDKSDVALEYYDAVVEELQQAKNFAEEIGLTVNFLHWCDPILLTQIDLSKICTDFNYKGFAIHPRLHSWRPNITSESSLLTEIFDFADKNKLEMYIHTGVSEDDSPKLYEYWYKNYLNVKVHLAHCKKYDEIIDLFAKYPNLVGDTAFCPKDCYDKICQAGFKNRMFWGTDFPITHYFEYRKDKNNPTYEFLFENYKHLLELEYLKSQKRN